MSFGILVVHVGLSIALFFIVNWIGKHATSYGYMSMSVLHKMDSAPAFNFLYRAVSPVVFVVLVAWTFENLDGKHLNERLYLVVPYYFILRLISNIVLGQIRLINWGQQFVLWSVSIGATIFVYERMIQTENLMLPEGKELSLAVWLGVIAFVYKTLNSISLSSKGTKRRKKSYAADRLRRYKKKFGSIVRGVTDDSRVQTLVYAIMIYEAFQRPQLARWVENLLFRVKRADTLGIMQVKTSRLINDDESVRIGAEKINELMKRGMERTRGHLSDDESLEPFLDEIRREVILKYNPDYNYVVEVEELYQILTKLSRD